jgi:hypothetical protein
MWDPQRLTTLWAFTACYRDSFTLLTFTNRGSSVSVVTGYGLDDGGLIAGRGSYFSLRHCINTESGAHKAAYPVGTGGKAAGS